MQDRQKFVVCIKQGILRICSKPKATESPQLVNNNKVKFKYSTFSNVSKYLFETNLLPFKDALSDIEKRKDSYCSHQGLVDMIDAIYEAAKLDFDIITPIIKSCNLIEQVLKKLLDFMIKYAINHDPVKILLKKHLQAFFKMV